MRVSPWVVPLSIVVLTAAGLGVAELFAIPTVDIELGGASGSVRQQTLSLVVQGVRCSDTARSAAANLKDEAGIVRFVAYASHNRVEITYDPTVTDQDSIVHAIEGPVYDETTGEFRFGVFKVIRIESLTNPGG